MEIEKLLRQSPPGIPGIDGRFYSEVLNGLSKPKKELPSKYFYDEKGSRLFDSICTLDEYYIPRLEAAIMSEYINEIVKLIGPEVYLLEYGSGNCQKARYLLNKMDRPVAYAPIDISKKQLFEVSIKLQMDYPELEVLPVCADYTLNFDLPVPQKTYRRKIVFFPGSTISNFDPIPAKLFLKNVAFVCGVGGGLVIGVDLKKEPGVLHKAYNDSNNITAAFNLNLLERINRELHSNFDLNGFEHYAYYNPKESRVEMHLVCLKNQMVYLGNNSVSFVKGDSIWTESSYKYNLEEFEQLAATAGFRVEKVWVDDKQWFSVQYLVVTDLDSN